MRRTQVFSARSDLTDWLEPLLCGATWGFWGLRSCLSCTCPALLSLPLSLCLFVSAREALSPQRRRRLRRRRVAFATWAAHEMSKRAAQQILLGALLNVCTLLHSTRTFTCRCCWLNTICLGPSIRHIQYTHSQTLTVHTRSWYNA